MELIESNCLLCGKFTSVLSGQDSILYFCLLNKHYFGFHNISDIQFKKIYINKHLCINCAYNVETMSSFLKNIIVRDFKTSISDLQCNMCDTESVLLCSSTDISTDFHEIKVSFVNTLIKQCRVDMFQEICVKCSFSLVTWNEIKGCFENILKNEEKPEKIDLKELNLKEQLKTNFKKLDVSKVDIDIKVNKRKSEFLDELKNIKTVSDYTLKSFRKLKENVVTNKQLMIDKPYVQLKKLKLDEYTCNICHIMFNTKSDTILHEFKHYAVISPRVMLTKCSENLLKEVTNDLIINSSLPSIQPTPSNNSLDTYDMLANMCETVYSDEEDSNLQIDKTPNQPQTNSQHDIIEIDSDNEDSSITNSSEKQPTDKSNDIYNNIHNYSRPITNINSGTATTYDQVYHAFLVKSRNTVNNTLTLCPIPTQDVLRSMLTKNIRVLTHKTVNFHRQPQIFTTNSQITNENANNNPTSIVTSNVTQNNDQQSLIRVRKDLF